MTNTIHNVPRELLERVLNAGWGSETVNALDDLRDFLESAPSPAGVDGLEVVSAIAWMNTATKEATTHPVVVMDWDDEKELVESLMPISQHEAIIDGLRGENERIRLNIAEYNEAISCYQSERDQQAQRIGELEGLLLDVSRHYKTGIPYSLGERIDDALSAGKEGA